MKGLYLKRGFYYFQPPTPEKGTRPKAIALKTRDFVTAVTEATRHLEDHRMQGAMRRGTLAEALPLYCAAKGADSPKTKRQRKVVLEGLKEILGNPRVDRITPELIAEWREHLLTTGGTLNGKGPVSNSTLKTYLIVVKAFFRWAREEGGYRMADPLVNLKRHTRIRVTRRHEFLTVAERDRLLKEALQIEDDDKRKYAKLIIHLGFFAGLRDGEMLAMTPDWLWISPDKTRGHISVQDTPYTRVDGSKGMWQPKGRHRRTIPLNRKLREFLADFPIKGPWVIAPKKEFWPNDDKNSKRFDAKKALAGLAKRAGVRKLNFHIMRHSFATHLVMEGVRIAEVAAMLGDTIKVTEENYAGFSPSAQNPLEVL